MFVILVWSLLPQSAPLVDRVRHLGVANLVKSLNPGVEQHFPLILSSNVCQSAHASSSTLLPLDCSLRGKCNTYLILVSSHKEMCKGIFHTNDKFCSIGVQLQKFDFALNCCTGVFCDSLIKNCRI